MSLFRLDASIRGEASISRQVADTAQAAWERSHPGQAIVRRDLVSAPVPAQAWPLAIAAKAVPADQYSQDQLDAVQLAAQLADEMVAADAYLFAIPLYNFGVSQHVKAWIDVLLTDPRFGPGQPPLLAGRPAALIVVRGGGYQPGTPRAG